VEAIEKQINHQLSEPLSRRVVRGGVWVFTLRIVNRGLGFIRTIILARLLAPEDFGLLGIAMLAISTLETFSQTGFQPALIQKKGNIKSYLNTAWTVSVIRGTILFLILFFSAPSIAAFFNSQQASLVIRVIALSTLLSGFKNIGIIFFQKDLEFNKQFYYEFSATIVDLSVAISLAFIMRNVWALVWGGLAANTVRLAMSYILHPYRSRLHFDKDKFHDLFTFGKWVLVSSILIFLITKGDDILVGKMLGITALGLYQMAYLISNLPATEITHVISQVTYPAYSTLQHSIDKLRTAYLRVLQLNIYITAPLSGTIFVLAPEFVRIFLGNKWMPMVPAVQVLVLAGFVRSIAATTGPIFHGIGKPNIDTKWQVVRLLTLVLLIYPLTLRLGILGTSITIFFSIFVSTIGFSLSVIKITKCEFKKFGKIIFFPIINTLCTILVIYKIKLQLYPINLFLFTLLIFVAIVIYIIFTYILEVFLNYGMMRIIREILTS
jgi:O-antigen/teichoic acid export membrane protein